MFHEEKKVEYIELIYDLIFVYLIGRSNELLHHFDGEFFTAGTYVTYLLSTVVILQVWYLSALFINRYGSNSLADFVGLFINMYLLYYMADGTRADWTAYYVRYNIAWGLILLNLALQYYLQLRKSSGKAPWEVSHIKSRMLILIIQAVMILASIPFYQQAQFPLSWLSIVVGFFATFFTRKIDALMPVNFEHLTERVMLYIVLTFGEMIVGIAVYFENAFSFNTFYYSAMAFLIVVGLFLSYGYVYDHIIDRNKHTTGSAYMLLHIVLLLALSNITAALEFMREPEVDLISKNILMVGSLILYYLFLFIISGFSKSCDRPKKKLIAMLIGTGVVFAGLTACFYNNAFVSIALAAAFVFGVFSLVFGNYSHFKPVFSPRQ